MYRVVRLLVISLHVAGVATLTPSGGKRVPLRVRRVGGQHDTPPGAATIICSPSLAKANLLDLRQECREVTENGAPWLHFPVQDGKFAPKISIGSPVVAAVREAFPDTVLDVKLSVVEPERHVATFVKAGADIISLHPESTLQLGAVLEQVNKEGCSPGVILNPAVPVQSIESVLEFEMADVIVIMLVNPGWGGDPNLDLALRKIKDINEFCLSRGCHLPHIEVDGGVSTKNSGALVGAGASVLVAGSSLFNCKDKRKAIRQLTMPLPAPRLLRPN